MSQPRDDESKKMIPESGVVASEEGRGRAAMSVRFPEPLHRELRSRSAKEGVPMNELVARAVADLLARPDLSPAPTTDDVSSQIAQDAVAMTESAIGPLKGIAKHSLNKGHVAMASVLYAAAARLVRQQDGDEVASLELAHTADVIEGANHYELAVALWREAVRLDPNNLGAVNRLGQRLHHLAQRGGDDVDRYREAERLLGRATFVDNYAKLFHGWSKFFVARADGDVEGQHQARNEVIEALKQWAFGTRDGVARRGWIRQLKRLARAGLNDEVRELVEFANRNAGWDPIGPDELSEA